MYRYLGRLFVAFGLFYWLVGLTASSAAHQIPKFAEDFYTFAFIGRLALLVVLLVFTLKALTSYAVRSKFETNNRY